MTRNSTIGKRQQKYTGTNIFGEANESTRGLPSGIEPLRITINEYKSSCAIIEGRIAELNALIACSGAAEAEAYAIRRELLRSEIWDMMGAVREMEEYCSTLPASVTSVTLDPIAPREIGGHPCDTKDAPQ